jgi:hypothetical protein
MRASEVQYERQHGQPDNSLNATLSTAFFTQHHKKSTPGASAAKATVPMASRLKPAGAYS